MRSLLKQFTQREASPFIQFVKYGIGGTIATASDFIIFSILAWKVFPCLKEDERIVQWFDLEVPAISDDIRFTNFVLGKTVAFLFSNLVAYIINIYWVFESGRHTRKKEVFLFYAVSITSFVIGTTTGGILIKIYGEGALIAYVANTIAAVMINFVCRKFIVFKG